MASNEELVRLIQSGIDIQDNTEALWLQNTGIVHKLAASYARDQYEADDLEQEAFFALQTAAKKYDQECGAKFITYFIIHLNARMRRYLAKTRPVVKTSVNLVDKVISYNKIKKQLKMELGAEPSDQMLCLLMEISQQKLTAIKKAAKDMEAQSLDDVTDDDESKYNKIPDPRDRIEELIDDIACQQLSEKLWGMVDKLNPREQEIIREIYLQDKTCVDIAKAQGVSRSRIDDIKHKALKKLKAQPESRQLQMMAQDVYGIAVKGVSLSAFRRTWTSATEYAAIALLEKEKQN